MLHNMKPFPQLSALGAASLQQRNCFDAAAHPVPTSADSHQSRACCDLRAHEIFSLEIIPRASILTKHL